MVARYFTLEEVLERVVNDDEVSDLDDESEEDIPDIASESDNNGDSSESETEFVKNTSDSDVSNEESGSNDGRDRSSSPRRSERGRARGLRGLTRTWERSLAWCVRARGGARARGGTRRADPELLWSRDPGIHTAPPQFAEAAPGPSRRFVNPERNSAKFYFDLLFTDDIWEMIVRETNNYYNFMVRIAPDKHKQAWSPVTRDEMEAFVGIMILKGIVKLPRFRMYWKDDILIRQEGISNVMPRTRFLQIWRYFHLADNSVAPPIGADGYDKLYRVREFLNIVSNNISREYKLSMNVAIDETMVPHKGRLSFKQYIRNKPTQWGIKLWVLSLAQTGYAYKFQVYLGKEGDNPEQHLARRVVRDLTAPIEWKNHHLYMDNLYCDPHLFIERIDAGIYCCGMVRPGRKGFPKEIVIAKADERHLQRGHYQFRVHDQLVAMSWFDRRGVYLLSTIHPPENPDGTLPTITRRNGREQVDVPCPPAEVDYQKYMGGVDLSDQLIKTFSVIRKSRNAWKLLGYGLEICLLDSFIIMRKANPQSTQEFIDFRLEVARKLITQRSFRRKAGRPPSLPLSETDEMRLTDKRHVLEWTDQRRDCAVCAKKATTEGLGKNFRYKSYIVCVTCNNTPLCINKDRNCWQKWHKARIYWQ